MSELLDLVDGDSDLDVIKEFGDGVEAIGSGVLVAENVSGITGLCVNGSGGVVSGTSVFFAKNGVVMDADGTSAPKMADGVAINCEESVT